MMEENSRVISERQLFPVIEEELSQNRRVRFTVSGSSMWPWIIHNRDSVLLEKTDVSTLRKGDIILFRTEFGHHVLHRITKVTGGGFVTTGDGNLHRDGLVPFDAVLARAAAIYRKDRVISCDSPGWRLLSWFWMFTFPVRAYEQKLILAAGRKNAKEKRERQ